MNGNVNLYDTYKANKDGKRYRVTEVGNETVKLVKLNEDDQQDARWRSSISKMHDTIAGLRSAGVKWQAAQRRCEELEKENDMLAKNLSELQQQVEKRNADAAAFLTSDELDIAMSYIDGAMTDPRDDKSGMTQAIAALDVILTLARGRTK